MVIHFLFLFSCCSMLPVFFRVMEFSPVLSAWLWSLCLLNASVSLSILEVLLILPQHSRGSPFMIFPLKVFLFLFFLLEWLSWSPTQISSPNPLYILAVFYSPQLDITLQVCYFPNSYISPLLSTIALKNKIKCIALSFILGT